MKEHKVYDIYLFNSIQFNSFNSIQFNSIQFNFSEDIKAKIQDFHERA